MLLIFPYLPRDTSRQYHALQEALGMMRSAVRSAEGPTKVLDLGCGRGDGYRDFLKSGLDVQWVGLDVADSPEASGSAQNDVNLLTYDGIHIPFREETFDVVYSRQTFEHVQYPRALIAEVSRVLKKPGLFVGSCSALEPFHSRSLWNFTPYGFATLLRDAHFGNIGVRPGVDAVSLIARRLLGLGRIKLGSRVFFKESAVNLLLELVTRAIGFGTNRRAAVKLVFCGHFVFSAVKTDD